MSSPSPETPGLGSLSQKARTKNLSTARNLILFIGIVTLLLYGVLFILAESMVDEAYARETQKLVQQGMIIDQVKLAELKQSEVLYRRAVFLVSALLGVVYIVLGIVIHRFPVPATVLALILYVASNVIFILLAGGTQVPTGYTLLIKLLILVALFRAVQTAIAYQKEQTALVLNPIPEPAP